MHSNDINFFTDLISNFTENQLESFVYDCVRKNISFYNFRYSLSSNSDNDKLAEFSDYSIELLHYGNNVVYEISTAGRSFVMTIGPDSIPQYLKDKINTLPYVTPTYFAKSVSYKGIQLQVKFTDKIAGGDLYNRCTDADRLINFSVETVLEEGVDFSIQIAEMLLVNKDNQIFNPDLKLANILYDTTTNKISVSDLKTFVATENSIINQQIRGQPLSYTPGYHWPEIKLPQAAVEQVHSIQLGRMIYQLVIGHDDNHPMLDDERILHDAKNYDFGDPTFETEPGPQLKNLIQRLVKYSPTDRLSVEEALTELKIIQQNYFINKNASVEVISSSEKVTPHVRIEEKIIEQVSQPAEILDSLPIIELSDEHPNVTVPEDGYQIELEEIKRETFTDEEKQVISSINEVILQYTVTRESVIDNIKAGLLLKLKPFQDYSNDYENVKRRIETTTDILSFKQHMKLLDSSYLADYKAIKESIQVLLKSDNKKAKIKGERIKQALGQIPLAELSNLKLLSQKPTRNEPENITKLRAELNANRSSIFKREETATFKKFKERVNQLDPERALKSTTTPKVQC